MNKVLIISYYWPPAGGSGVQRWLKFTKYLPKNNWQPIFINTHSYTLNLMANQFMHGEIDPTIAVPHEPSKYTFLSILNSLCEIIVWMGKFMDENQTSKKLNLCNNNY